MRIVLVCAGLLAIFGALLPWATVTIGEGAVISGTIAISDNRLELGSLTAGFGAPQYVLVLSVITGIVVLLSPCSALSEKRRIISYALVVVAAAVPLALCLAAFLTVTDLSWVTDLTAGATFSDGHNKVQLVQGRREEAVSIGAWMTLAGAVIALVTAPYVAVPGKRLVPEESWLSA